MSRLFKDSFGISYDAANGKYVSALFGQTASSPNPNLATLTTEATSYIPFNFGSLAGVEQSADLTALGNINDCAECHVGGGGMEYIPKYQADGAIGSSFGPGASPANRVSLRTAGTTGGILDGLFSSFNYLIDIFGPKGDGKGATYSAIKNDFAQSGVLEMDCFTCHLEGYDWEARKHAVRALGFDASRVTGAGFGTYSTGRTPSTTVKYDAAKLVGNNTDGWKLAPVMAAKISPIPPSDNCATCHAATLKEKFQVEWKKRGDFWGGSEVHSQIGCMGCHERNDLNLDGTINKANVGKSGIANTAAANKKLGLCDPAKGGDSDYDAQWNAMDKVAFKNCSDCHVGGTSLANGKSYGAPNPTEIHAQYGLTAKIAQTGTNGVANASHLDILDCTVCHALKNDVTVPMYKADGTFRNYTTFPITGGAMVDGTGKDEEGRLATHDTVKVEREMKGNYSLYWKNGKLFLGSFLTSFFWRDQNTGYDANKDGRGPGLDPILTTHVAKLNEANNRHALMEDGVVTSTEIQSHIDTIKAGLPALNGAAGTPVIRLSALAVPFKWTHNIAPAAQALGKDCADCHSAASPFLNGKVVVSPKTNFTYGANQIVTYAKVNGSSMGTDFHPNVVNKAGNRSIALQIFNTAGGNLSDASQAVSRAAMIYEGTTFKAPNTAFVDSITGTAISSWKVAGTDDAALSSGTAGWVLKIEEKDVATGTVTPRTFSVSDNALTSVAGLITHMGGFASGSYGFTITEGTNSNLVITAKAGKQIRLAVQNSVPAVQTDCGPLGLCGSQYVASPTIGVNNQSYADRTAWVNYFNSTACSDKAAFGIGIAPVAAITTIGGQAPAAQLTLTQGAATALVATNAASAGKFTYKWAVNDNSGVTIAATQSSSYNFPKEGIYYVSLTVTDEEGLVSTTSQKVSVVAPDPVVVGTIATDAVSKITTIPVTVAGATSVTFTWGDGSANNTYALTAGAATGSHKYVRFAKYLVAGKYQYTTTIRAYNGGALIYTKNITVQIAP